ncbi:MAG: uroporphyrinogen-III C-methyltransferase [Alphaproteobacteria bacterium]|nr:uroporphyrinogen-III C-methyltransferase [Alphaproteobacteria bacterium]
MALLDTFPVSVKVAGRAIVVIGGGIEALNKTRLALRTSADIRVWARRFEAGFDELDSGRLTLNRREDGLETHLVGSFWLDDAVLVFVADSGADGRFAEAEARARGIPVNVVDTPERCDFYTPAIVDRAPLSVAIATEGAAPVIARRVRAAIEAVLPPALGELAALAGSLRGAVEKRLPAGPARRRYYERLVDSADIAALLTCDPETARRKALDLIDSQTGAEPGAVAWVGAGPGAEDLLTLRAQRLLQAADIIVHDRSVPAVLIDMGRRDAERLPVDPARSPVAAAETGALAAGLAQKGRRVVRLVGGSGGEAGDIEIEIAAARRAGIFVSVVPGVAAAASQCDIHRIA